MIERNVERLVWLDVETTGHLDANLDHLLNVGVIVTDRDLNRLRTLEIPIWQSAAVIQAASPWAQKHHTASGVFARSRESDTDTRAAEEMILRALVESGCGIGKGVLAGFSVHTDRAQLKRHMPTIDRWLSYRHLDVSVFRIMADLCGVDGPFKSAAQAAHTPLADLEHSIACFKWARDRFEHGCDEFAIHESIDAAIERDKKGREKIHDSRTPAERAAVERVKAAPNVAPAVVFRPELNMGAGLVVGSPVETTEGASREAAQVDLAIALSEDRRVAEIVERSKAKAGDKYAGRPDHDAAGWKPPE